MNEPIDWTHRESLRMWRVLAAQGHEGAQQVMAQPHIQDELRAHQQRVALYAHLPMTPPTAAVRPVPQQSAALTPQAPRAVVPAVPQATPALAGITRRTEVLTSLLGARPATAAPTDKTLV